MKTELNSKKLITIEVTINSSIEKVWEYWTNPHYILHWNHASDDWQTTWAENTAVSGGSFSSHMEAKDGSFGFDFYGIHTRIEKFSFIESTLGDGRIMRVKFTKQVSTVNVTESFETELTNSIELQREGWLSILRSFKSYVEKSVNSELLNFEISISAPVEKVEAVMFDDKTYKEWTSVFNPASRYEGDWSKGSKILFLGTGSDGETGGMVSRIKENIPGRFVSIEHLGIIKDGLEVMNGPEVDVWKGSLENYTFKTVDGSTLLSVDIDSDKNFISYFMKTWPEALSKIKSICEK